MKTLVCRSENTTGEIYTDTVLFSRVKSGNNEEDIKLATGGNFTNLNVEITTAGEDGTQVTVPQGPGVIAVWGEERADKDGIDIKIAVANPNITYNVKITPRSINGYLTGEVLHPIETTFRGSVSAGVDKNRDYLTLSEFKLKDLVAPETYKFRTGDKLYADITYLRNYSNEHLNVSNIPVEVQKITKSNDIVFDVEVTNKETNQKLVNTTENTYYTVTPYNNGETISRVEITIEKDLLEQVLGRGTLLNICPIISKTDNFEISGAAELKIYRKSTYNLSTQDTIGLNLRNEYTLVPFTLSDQYGTVEVTKDMYDKNFIVESSLITSGYIQAIPVKIDNYEATESSDIVKYIGIKVDKTKANTLASYDAIEKGTIEIKVGEAASSTISRIFINTGVVNSLKQIQKTEAPITTCYEPIEILKLASNDIDTILRERTINDRSKRRKS